MFDQPNIIAIVALLFSFALKVFWVVLGLYAFFLLRQATFTLRRIAVAQEQIDHQLGALVARENGSADSLRK